jgi:Flp pilus assembly protein TadG
MPSLLETTRGFILRLRRDHAGTVGVVAALALPAMIAMSSLVAEYGHALLVKTENQRVADLAAYAGALAYNGSSSTSSMSSAAKAIAALNRVPAAAVTATLIASPTGDGNQSVHVQVSTKTPLYLAQVVGAHTSVTVTATSDAELNARATPCVLALSGGGTGVKLSGGTALTATKCAVASNNTLVAPCGTSITSMAVSYNGAVPTQPCGGIKSPSGGAARITKKAVSDPLAATSAVVTAASHLTTVSNLSAPASPVVVTGVDVDFGYTQSSTQSQLAAAGCSGTYNSNTWTVSCPSGTFHFGAISLAGGISVDFATGAPLANAYTFSGVVKNSGSRLTFGNGSFQLAKGLVTGGGSTTSFGVGSFWIGQGAAGSCGFSICHSGTSLSFGGSSSFIIAGGVYSGGGATLSMGAGASNSFRVGPSSTGDAFSLNGGAKTYLADALGGSSLFQIVGNINVAGGGSCTTISAAAQHDVRGALTTAGGTILGAGPYSLTGYVALGANNGGDVSCNGAIVGMQGTGVVFVLGGASPPTSGGCAGQAFCLAAGYGNVSLIGPTSGPLAGLVVMGPQSGSAGALFSEGASNTSLSGALYFPNGPISLSGGANIGSGAGQCLEIIGTQVTLSGGTTAASDCFSRAGGSASSIMLVQ